MFDQIFDDFDRKDDEEERYRKKCPVCDVCGDYITDDYFIRIGNEYYHEDCVDRVHTETWVENNS